MTGTLTYTMQGEYQYPNLSLPQKEELPLGKYGRMHRKFLKENRRVTYNRLLLAGTLDEHLTQIDQQASEMMERLTRQMAEREGVTEQMKAEDQMRWVGLMNNIRHLAEEIVLNELIYN